MKPAVIIGLVLAAGAVAAFMGLNREEDLAWGVPRDMLDFAGRSETGPRLAGGTQVAQASPPARATAPAEQQVDETALRYFARQGDTKRLEAEIARLRALYPQWRPPADPLAIPPQGDPQLDAVWKLYSEGRYAEVRKAIADRAAADPSWQPPKDLVERLEIAESRERLINASDLKQYQTVIRVAAETPTLLTCSDVDVLWRVGEAFARTGNIPRAEDAYSYVLSNCDDPAERLATVEKAIPLLPREGMDRLFALERPGADGKGEFAPARADLARSSVAAAGMDPKVEVPAGDLAALETVAEAQGKASDSLLLGWYFIGRKDLGKAETWFSKARKIADTAEASQGLALALIGQNRPGEAEDILYRWRDASDDVRNVYLAATANLLAIEPPVPLAPSVLERIVAEVASARDPATAQQLGWYARSLNQHQTAGQWFAAALQWKPDDEPSAYGLALTRLQLGDRAGVAEIQRQWAGRSDRIAQLGETRNRESDRLPAVPAAPNAPAGELAYQSAQPGPAPQPLHPRATRAPAAEQGARAPQRRGCARTDLHSSLTGEAALMRGWCLMELNRPAEAALAFEAAMETSNAAVRRDAAWGQSLAYLRSGLTDKAAVAAAKAPQSRERAVELQASILSQRATSFFEAGRYVEALLALDQRARIAAERNDLMALRGYAYLSLGRLSDARQVFQALAATGSREGLRGLAAVEGPTEQGP